MGTNEHPGKGQGGRENNRFSESPTSFELATNPLLDEFAEFLRAKPKNFNEIIEQIIHQEARPRNRVIEPNKARGILAEVYTRYRLMEFARNRDIVVDPIPHSAVVDHFIFKKSIEGGMRVLDIDKIGELKPEYPQFDEYDALMVASGLPVAIEVKSGTKGKTNGFASATNLRTVSRKLKYIKNYFKTDKFGYMAVSLPERVNDSNSTNIDKFKKRGGIVVALPITSPELDTYAGRLLSQNDQYRKSKSQIIK
ncbi:MAG TPA: hypothetical protein VM077_02835 [Candidatus Limnocylindrales bacterium]|nr:hypothetical protein [Candidatus Limnocylindrales bacterium]